MSDLAWAVKNGDLDQVKELVDNKVTYLDWHVFCLHRHEGISDSGTENYRDNWRDLMWTLRLTEDWPCTMPVTTVSWRSSNICVPRYLRSHWEAGQPHLLCFQGANLNAEDKHGISPLLAGNFDNSSRHHHQYFSTSAVWEGHTSCVKFLLEKVSKENHDWEAKYYTVC